MNRDDKRDNRQKDTGQDAGPKKQGWLRTFGTALNMELREHKSSAIVYLTLRACHCDDDSAAFEPEFWVV